MTSTYEFEVRYAVKDHGSIREALHKMGAKCKAKIVQRDYYFTPPPVKSIKKGSILRIRKETNQEGKRRVLLSYKTPNIPRTGVETREETEVEVLDDVSAARRLLERLQARLLVLVVKEREEYTLTFDGISLTVTLDRVENLGSFVELELVSSSKQDVNHLIRLGEQVAARLGIDLSQKVIMGYHELMLERE